MRGARRRVLILLTIVAIAGALLAAKAAHRLFPVSSVHLSANRPRLLLLTSLPLIFNEEFSLHHGGSAALRVLQDHYDVVPISIASPAELGKGKLLLMAQPLPQTAENLVVLDQWVRQGGRLILFADPMLEWPSTRPFGDRLRPPAMFMDTGLLAHWGLRLDAPDIRGPAERRLGRYEILTVSPGSLNRSSSSRCRSSADGLVAHCSIGKGEATIVADADLLNVDELGPKSARNLDSVLDELEQLESHTDSLNHILIHRAFLENRRRT